MRWSAMRWMSASVYLPDCGSKWRYAKTIATPSNALASILSGVLVRRKALESRVFIDNNEAAPAASK